MAVLPDLSNCSTLLAKASLLAYAFHVIVSSGTNIGALKNGLPSPLKSVHTVH